MAARVLAFVLSLAAVPGPAAEAGDEAVALREIADLVAAIGTSGCEFQRNGRWHGADAAQAHLQRKLEWARDRGFAGTAEDFIGRMASRSSVGGRPYRVRCDGVELLAADWFAAELERLRAANSSRTGR
ncbi:DUF5329 family protein [Luteimonas saliphila]|uniref:DUF5329 family protein n=1 Tax=Luteimonas saliphila TaxID=2804919 RepID=UPI0030808B39